MNTLIQDGEVIRVMLEGEDYIEISEYANMIADLIRTRLS